MRRRIALAATALIAPALAMTTPAPAQAAPATALVSSAGTRAVPGGPADALLRQFAKGTTVRIDEVTRMRLDGDELFNYRQSGVVRFGKSGVDAYDLRTSGLTEDDGHKSTMRAIMIDGKLYMKSPLFDDLLPAGRSWIRADAKTAASAAGATDGVLDVLRPAVLKAVLASTKTRSAGGTVGGVRTTLLRGSITLGRLTKVAPYVNDLAKAFKIKEGVALPWKLWIGADQLPAASSRASRCRAPAPTS